MKKKLAIVIGMLIIIPCFAIGISRSNSNKLKQDFINYTFKGENEHWTVSYNVKTYTYDNIGKNYANYKLSIIFKGNISKLSKSKKLTYSYESSAGNGGTTLLIDNLSDEELKIFESGSRNIVENEDEIINVSINVDGDNETIKLKNNKIEP
jgi:hypothetical protein